MSNQGVIKRIEEILEHIRPSIQLDGGDIEFVKFEEGIVYVRFQGACVGCPVSMYTLKLGVEESLKQELDEVHEVLALE